MPLAPPTPEQLARLRGDFTPEYFINLVRTKGYPATWEKAMICPNRIGDRSKHDLNCILCDGREYIWFGPENIRVALTSLSLKEMQREIGRFDLGTAMVTSEPGHRLSYWDKLTLLESRIRYTEVLQRKPSHPDRLRYAPIEMIKVLGESVGEEYFENVDFTLDGNNLNWAAGKGPKVKGFYSLAYFHRPVYIVLDLVHMMRDTPIEAQQNNMVEMPVQTLARLDFLVKFRQEDGDQ